ncbi:MAG: Maf family protein [Hydrotalea sp.]|nr:Maf family protein [Hydrotalea sp.]
MVEKKIILASASLSRLNILRGAGLDVTAVPAHVDETAIKKAMQAAGARGEDVAMKLAELKAEKISKQQPDALVLGADQLLLLLKDGGGEIWFDKPKNLAEAKNHLSAFSGKTHFLATALVMYQGGMATWRVLEKPAMTCWAFDGVFIDNYIARAGNGILLSVGAYQLEGLGAHLFSRVEGDYFSILGLPLLPLLRQLRLMAG